MLQQSLNWLKKGWLTLINRLQTQGLRVTLIWFYARGVPYLTGIPVMKYSRITPAIYVGPQFRPAGKRRLQSLGFTASLNLRAEFDDCAHQLDLQQHCYLPTQDDHAPTLDQLEQGIRFIRQVLAASGKVYIHCRGGIGRAPTMAAAYLIAQGATLDQALCLIRDARPFIRIMPLQMQRLKEIEAEKLNQPH